jgi:hypothetical protein
VIFSLQSFIKNFNRINWSATFKAAIESLTSKKNKKSKTPSVSSPENAQSEQPISPTITVSPVSEDAEIEAWLNKITEKASRTTSKSSKPAAKKSVAKKAVVTKKAAPKSTKKR